MSKRVLLTGATGFVGANLARRLVAEGHDVTAIVRADGKRWRIQDIGGLRSFTATLTDADAVRAAVRSARPQWIFHLAAYGAYPSERSWTEMVATNVTGTANLVQACLEAGFESFVNTGSSSEYGFKSAAADELASLEPNSGYAVTKATATLYCGLMARSHQALIRTLRLYSVYGPWEEPTRLVPTLVLQGLRDRLPVLAGRDVARDFVFVDDVCDAYLAVASNHDVPCDAIFNVGTGVQTTLETAVSTVRRLLDMTAEPVWGSMPNRAWDTDCWVADIRKIRGLLGWTPRHSLDEGLAATIEWFRANPSMVGIYGEAARRVRTS